MIDIRYLRYVAAVCAAAATLIIAAMIPSTAEARGRYKHRHYSSHGYYVVHKARHRVRRASKRQRMTIAVGRPDVAPTAYYAVVSDESPVQFNLSQSGAAPAPAARPNLVGDGTFGDLVQGTYGGTRDLVRAAERYLYTNPTGRSRAWCRAFVNLVARQSGYRINPSLMARAPTGGYRVRRPVPGAVAKSRHHTGFVKSVSADGRKILLISGNSGGSGPGRRTTTASWRSASLFNYEVLRR